jgi:Protein of unknown function (DUF1997)
MQTEFFASQSVLIQVPPQVVPIQHYLRQPQRLVYALTDPSRVESLGEDIFRLKMRPLSFLMLSLQPTVDMRVRVSPTGEVRLRSVACEIRGVEYINQRFQFDLLGRLAPKQRDVHTELVGQADLRVKVDLPPALWFTPKSLLETTGNGLLKSVLMTMKQRLIHHLIQDYCEWSREIDGPLTEVPTTHPTPPLGANLILK